ncbi:MAG: GntR family transcriptional regulator [Candidatus Elarobacter sp.]
MNARVDTLRVDSSSLSKRVLVRLRDRIIAGAVPAGTWLRLADLARELGTSITPVRAALAELETQGLVEVAKARGYRVVPPSDADIRDAYLIAGFISGELSARAASRADDTFVARVRELQRGVELAARSGSGEELDAANWAFHRTINQHAPSPRLDRLLRAVIRSVPHQFHSIVSGWTGIAIKHHRELVRALAAKDPVRARAVAEKHVALGCTQLLHHLAEVRRAESASFKPASLRQSRRSE